MPTATIIIILMTINDTAIAIPAMAPLDIVVLSSVIVLTGVITGMESK